MSKNWTLQKSSKIDFKRLKFSGTVFATIWKSSNQAIWFKKLSKSAKWSFWVMRFWRIEQSDWPRAFRARTREPDFFRTCGFRRMIENHNILQFTSFPEKTNERTYGGEFIWPFRQSWGSNMYKQIYLQKQNSTIIPGFRQNSVWPKHPISENPWLIPRL